MRQTGSVNVVARTSVPPLGATRPDLAESKVTVAGLGDHHAGVSGATCNSRQLGSPPKRSRWVPMKRVISAVAGRAPVRNKPGPPSASHWRGAACDARAQACRSRSRSPVVSALVRPKFEAIEVVVAHCDACSAWCSNTIRTFPLADLCWVLASSCHRPILCRSPRSMIHASPESLAHPGQPVRGLIISVCLSRQSPPCGRSSSARCGESRWR